MPRQLGLSWSLVAERSERGEDSFWSQSVCDGSGVSERAGAVRSGQTSPGRWLQTMGRVFAVSDPWNGRSHGIRKILVERMGFVWRRFRLAYRCPNRIWSVVVSLSARCARQTNKFFHRPGIFPDHVRIDGALRGVRRIFRDVHDERIAALVSSHVQLGTVYARNQRRIFPGD